MKKGNTNAVVGVFYTRSEAEQAIHELRNAGFAEDSVGMISRDSSGRMVKEDGDTLAGEGAAAGAVVGAGAGALAGLGMIAGTIPVIGPVIALGTLGAVLVSAAGGAAILGLVGALIGLGIPEDEARYYESEVHGGRFLITVDAPGREAEAWSILHRAGGYNRTNPPLTAPVPM